VNIKDLPQGSYKVIGGQPPIQPSQSGMVNVRDLPQNSYKVLSGQMPEVPAPKPFRFDVPADVIQEDRQAKTTRLKAEALKAQAEARSKSGFFGMLKAGVEPFVSSELALGETLGKAFSANTALGGATENIGKLTDSNLQLLRQIKENEKTGKDSTALKRMFNANANVIEQNGGDISKYKDELPTTAQAMGQVGGVALDLLTAGTYGKATAGMKTGVLAKESIPFAKTLFRTATPALGKVAEIASKPTGIGTVQGIKNITKGAGIGYGFDVTQGLQGTRGEDRTGTSALIPGLGTLIGASLPALSEVGASQKNYKANAVNRIMQKRENELADIEKAYSTLRKLKDFSKDQNQATRKRIASVDVLAGSVDDNGKINTRQAGGAVEQYKKMTIDGAEGVVRKNIEREGSTVNLANVQKELTDKINKSGLEGKDLQLALNNVKKEIAGYRLRADVNGNVPLTVIHDAKVNTYNNTNYLTPPEVKKYNKTLANGLKTIVENNSDFNVGQVNDEIGKYLGDIKYLELLDGKIVKGGKLGKYFSQITGNIAGGMAGGAIGGIPGQIIGTVVGGEIGNRLKSSSLHRMLGGETGNIIEQSAIIKKAIELSKTQKEGMTVADYQKYLSRKGTQTPQYSNKPTIIPKNGIPTTLPQLGTKVKAGDIKVNDFQKGISVISKESLAKTAKELAEKKSSGLIKVTDYTKPQYPRYITPDMQNRMAKVLTLKENQGKSVDMLVLEVQKKFVDIDGITPGEQDIRKMIVDMRDVKKKVNLTPGIKNVEAKGAVGAKEAVAKGMTEEQYVKGQGTPLYHGTLTKFNAENIKPSKGTQGTGIYLDLKKETATRYAKGGEVLEFAGQDLKLADTTKFTKAQSEQFSIAYENAVKKLGEHSDEATNIAYKSMGFDGKKITNTEIMLFDSSKVKTTSQLRAEYKAAKALTPNK